MMRHSGIVMILLLAGCVGAPTESDLDAASVEDEASDAAAAGDAAGGTLEGTLWLPPSNGQAREETLLEIPANFSGMLVVADLAVGSSYGPAELPATTADVLVELRGPDGEVLGEAWMRGLERTATIESTTKADGTHTLAILSYGGSDGAANGDHVHYHVGSKKG